MRRLRRSLYADNKDAIFDIVKMSLKFFFHDLLDKFFGCHNRDSIAKMFLQKITGFVNHLAKRKGSYVNSHTY